MSREKTTFGTVVLWNAFYAARSASPAVTPETVTTMARIVEAVVPEITYTPHQLAMALNYEAGPRVNEQYPALFEAQTAAEAVDKLGCVIVLHADTSVKGQGWQQGDPRLDIP